MARRLELGRSRGLTGAHGPHADPAYKRGAGPLDGAFRPRFPTVRAVAIAVHAELPALQNAGLSPYAVLEAATRNAAEYLGKLDETGTIAPGRRGDLLLLEANPVGRCGQRGTNRRRHGRRSLATGAVDRRIPRRIAAGK